MKIIDGRVYLDQVAEQVTMLGLMIGTGAMALTITGATILGAIWLCGPNMHVPLGYTLRVGVSVAVAATATAFIGILWQIKTP